MLGRPRSPCPRRAAPLVITTAGAAAAMVVDAGAALALAVRGACPTVGLPRRAPVGYAALPEGDGLAHRGGAVVAHDDGRLYAGVAGHRLGAVAHQQRFAGGRVSVSVERSDRLGHAGGGLPLAR